MTSLELMGCPYQPLGAYLKALAVLRLVSEQEDREARGRWTDECFVLESTLDRDGLLNFFLSKYSPTPVVAPWNGGSGFYPKDRKVGVSAIESSEDSRFNLYRDAISTVRRILARAGAEKSASKGEEDSRREQIVRFCRNELSDRAVDWLDAAIAIAADGSRAFAPILGTGGNEGRLDYTNNFMENLSTVLISSDTKLPRRALLENALFGVQTGGMQDISVGQYDPGRCGGFNQGPAITSGAVANPWNAVLTIEGAIAWAGGIYRKQGTVYRSFLCSPFTVRPSAVGYGSANDKDQVTARAEIWAPLWERAARFAEIRALLREGRAAVNGRPARTGFEFAQAAASLGVDRAISRFMRYSIVKRRGDSYVALPAGRFPVQYRRNADLIGELTSVVRAGEQAARDAGDSAANSWRPLRREVEEASYRTLLHDSPEDLRDAAAALGAIHIWLLKRGKTVPGLLSEPWIKRCAKSKQTAAEVYIAAALAGIRSHPEAGPLRDNLLSGGPHFSWTGRDLPERMLATLRRRSMCASESDRSPFSSTFLAAPSDVAMFINGDVDDVLIERLIHAFLLVKGSRGISESDDEQIPWPVYCLLKQLFAAGKLDTPKGEVRIKPDLAIPALLSAGRTAEAAGIAARRLRILGLTPTITGMGEHADPVRLGAALLIPVRGMRALLLQVVENFDSVLV
jgi:CRISPR-associated protein Csx17